MTDPLIPPPLPPGGTIGIIAPSGQLQDRQLFESGVQILGEMGFQVKFPPSLWPGCGYLADTDKKRADELNRIWADPDIHAVMAARGGYGCLRILDRLDLPMIRRTPKLLVGFSDLTILQTYLQRETAQISLHGPVVTSLAASGEATRDRLHHSLLGQWSDSITWKMRVLRSGRPRGGILVGGNLSSLITLLETPFTPNWQGKILFLEDVNEPLYRLDRMLTHLHYAGKFKEIEGLILGDFSISRNQSPQERIRHHESVWLRALELTASTGIPVWGGFPAGHGEENLALPIGAEALMESDTLTLHFR